MRFENSVKIAKSAVIYQIVNTVLGLINRYVLVIFLGKEYLGFTGLFSNIISMLALSELGLGSAIAYNLYEPLYNNDRKRISALVNFYKKIYRFLAAFVFSLGVVLLFFLQYLIKDIDKLSFDIGYIRLLFFLTLMETVFSYLMVYKTTLLNVGQKRYIINNINTITVVLLTCSRIAILYFTKNYILYVALGVCASFLRNFIASRCAVKHYPFITGRDYKELRITEEDKESVIHNAANLSVHTFSGYVVNCTDNLIISTFVGVITLGLYSNYNLIFTAVKSLINGVVTSIQAPLGDLVVSNNKTRVGEVVDIVSFVSFAISSFCAVSLFVLSSPFIIILFGSEYVLDIDVVLICAINLFVWTMTRPIWSLSAVTGLFKEDRINAFIEAVSNLVISIIAVQFWGLTGTFIGTLCSYIIAFSLKTRLQFTKYFKHSPFTYLKQLSYYMAIFLLEMVITYIAVCLVSGHVRSEYICFGVDCLLCIFIPNLVNYTLFHKTKEYSYMKSVLLKRITGNH